MYYVVATVLLVLCLLGIPYLMRRKVWKNLNLEIMNNDFDTYYFTIDSLKAQLSMSAFERENMRFERLYCAGS